MAKFLKITNPNELDSVNDLIHDCFFNVNDVELDRSSSVLSFRFLRLVTTCKYWWRDVLFTNKMRPAFECFLRICHVDSYSIHDTQKVGTYDFNVLDYDPSRKRIAVRTGIPIDIAISVRDFGVSVEVTENLSERTEVSGSGSGS